MCSRHYSVGADGVIFALPGKDGADYTMRIYNSDGELTGAKRKGWRIKVAGSLGDSLG